MLSGNSGLLGRAAPFGLMCLSVFASASMGGMSFRDLSWSPDSRFLAFSYSFVFDDEDCGTTEAYLAFYDVEREVAWSPHEGESLTIPELGTTYVANRLGVYAVPTSGGPWTRLLGPESFINTRGRPLYYWQQTHLRYDPGARRLVCAVLGRRPGMEHSQGYPALIEFQLPEGRLTETRYAERSADSSERTGSDDPLFESMRDSGFMLLPAKSSSPAPPDADRLPADSGVLLHEVSPLFNHLSHFENVFAWREPHTLILQSIPRLRPAPWQTEPFADLPTQLEVSPEGLVTPFAEDRSRVLHTARGTNGHDPDWEKLWAQERPRYRYFLRVVPGNARWMHSTPFLLQLDQDARPLVLAGARVRPSAVRLPERSLGNHTHDDGHPKAGAHVFLWPLAEDDWYFGDLAKATQVFFKDIDVARGLADQVTPFLRGWFVNHDEEEGADYSGAACLVDVVDLRSARGLAQANGFWYILLMNRLWRLNPSLDHLELAIPNLVHRCAVAPDARHIAAVVTDGYCAERVIVLDIESAAIKTILPPQM